MGGIHYAYFRQRAIERVSGFWEFRGDILGRVEAEEN